MTPALKKMRGRNFVDITGQQYGHLTALYRIPESSPVRWKCRCSCGNEHEARGAALRYGQIKSCGCKRGPEKGPRKKRESIIGKKFGLLTVEKKLGKKGDDNNARRRVLCRCDCGNKMVARDSDLVAGNTKSCGCLRKARGAEIEGVRFGKLVALRKLDKRDPRKNVLWKVLCDCGNEKIVPVASLVSGGTRSCGCLRKGPNEKLRIDIEGLRSGHLVATSFSHMDQHHHSIWKAVCDCGNQILVNASQMKAGRRSSCGCYKKPYKERSSSPASSRRLDISGVRSGKLVATEFDSMSKHGHSMWKAACDCGNSTVVEATLINRGLTKSCGCLRGQPKNNATPVK